MGLTIACKSLDKRPGIVKTRRDRDSILIFYRVSSRYAETIKDKSWEDCNSNGDSRHFSPTRTGNSW